MIILALLVILVLAFLLRDNPYKRRDGGNRKIWDL